MAALALLVVLAGCAPVDDTPMISIIGATLIDGTGGAPVPESVVVVLGSRVREAGGRATVPTPARARNVDARGKFVTPRLIDLGQTQLAAAATNDELRKLLDSGTSAYGSLPAEIDPALLMTAARFAYGFRTRALAAQRRRPRARHAANGQLASAGVPIGVASAGDAGRELQLLSDAGLSPMDVLVAATRNGALVQHKSHEMGTLTAGKFANLVLLPANPLDDVRNLTRPERAMVEGRWVN